MTASNDSETQTQDHLFAPHAGTPAYDTKRSLAAAGNPAEPNTKRTRFDSTVALLGPTPPNSAESSESPEDSASPASPASPAQTPAPPACPTRLSLRLPAFVPTPRRHRFRSRSLPNLYAGTLRDSPRGSFRDCHMRAAPLCIRANHCGSSGFGLSVSGNSTPYCGLATASTAKTDLPPVNLQSLREIDLHEILKNPQLRHDIVFDPQLQFRPNLDGERGRRKKQQVDSYWDAVQTEFETLRLSSRHGKCLKHNSRIPGLFTTLRDILVSLLPAKDRPAVHEVFDVDLLLQQLSVGQLDFAELAEWLAGVFKAHCAPMRDVWVDFMQEKFAQAVAENSIRKLVGALRVVFSILEAMKLDVANHQIRVLRPVLVDTAAEFEREYFVSLLRKGKIGPRECRKWLNDYEKAEKRKARDFGKDKENIGEEMPNFKPQDNKIGSTNNITENVLTRALLRLLTCRKLTTEFPPTLAFDHARLVLLRTEIRQLICLQLCLFLYKQLCTQPPSDAQLAELKSTVLAIITDDNGSVKWTRNGLHIAMAVVKAADEAKGVFGTPNSAQVKFAASWLYKQTQPSSEVYKMMEERVFRMLEIGISHEEPQGGVFGPELLKLHTKLSLLVKFHWNVFGNLYLGKDLVSGGEDAAEVVLRDLEL